MSQSTSIPPSYLSLCIQDLSPDKVSTFNTQSTLWKAAAVVTVVAFMALAVVVFVSANIFMPIYAPLTAITALLMAAVVYPYVKSFLNFSEEAHKEAEKHKTIQHNYTELSKRSIVQIQQELAGRGIQWTQIPTIPSHQPEKLADLNPLLAQAKYLDTKIEEDMKHKESMGQEASALFKNNPAENRNKIHELRHGALFAEHRALQTKIQAAFVNAVLRKGDYNGSLETIGSQAPINYEERILGNALGGDPSINDFFTFKDRSIDPLSYQDVKTLNISQLGQRLIAGLV